MQITSQEKNNVDTLKNILATMATLCQKMEKIESEVQILKETVNSKQHDSKHVELSHQHDSKHAELSQQHDSKHAELKGDVGKHLKTHNKMIYAAAGSTSTRESTTKKEDGKIKYTNTNMNKLFSKPYLSENTQKDIFVPPQINTYKTSLDSHKQIYNHITRTYIENIHKIQTFLNLNPRAKNTQKSNENYITQHLQRYN